MFAVLSTSMVRATCLSAISRYYKKGGTKKSWDVREKSEAVMLKKWYRCLF